MADELAANAPLGQTRSPRQVAWLALATLGIYGLVWFYKYGKELDAAGNFGIDPKRWYRQIGILAGLVITLPVALAHFYVYAFRVAKETEELARLAKETQVEVEGRFPLIVIPFGGVVYLAILQRAANTIWARMRERRRERERALEEAKAKKPGPVEQVVQCPQCDHVITIRYIRGEAATIRCTSCGFTAPFDTS